ncbi:MAG: gliding motility-associated C-terminal domain-containing protein [Candidatus Cyclobacteriaceae bacterium M3_2C_046]
MILSFASFGQETGSQCNDGIDNDGDGFFDCYDKDCSGEVSCSDFFMNNNAMCEVKPTEFPDFEVQNLWKSYQTTTNKSKTSNHTTIYVGDIMNDDDIPEVVAFNSDEGKIFIINGQTGENIKSADINLDWQEYATLGKLNKSHTCGWIWVSKGNEIVAYDCDLNIQWESGEGGIENCYDNTGTLGLADFNGDGNIELYYKNEIRDAETGNILVKGTGNWSSEINAGPVAVNIDDSDNDLELVIGLQIFKVDLAGNLLTLFKEPPPGEFKYHIKNSFGSQNHNFTSVADYDLDGHLDVIANGADDNDDAAVFYWNVNLGEVKMFVVPNAGTNAPNGTGRVNVANIDDTPELNCTFAVKEYLYALDADFNLKWELGIIEGSSGNTGTTVFDFNGDGESEIIYRDEKKLYVVDGRDGSETRIAWCPSQTGREYPVVADVNGDGETEICVSCQNQDVKNKGDRGDGEIRLYGSLDEKWMPARSVWNQHGYFNVNINDNLTIPRGQQLHHMAFGQYICDSLDSSGNPIPGDVFPLNSFLNQSPKLESNGCLSYASPDLTFDDSSIKIFPPTCPDLDFYVSFNIQNHGDIVINRDLYVTFYEGDPDNGGVKLNTDTVTITDLKPGTAFWADSLNVKGTGTDFDLYIKLNDPQSVLECDNGNNKANRKINPLPFSIRVEKVKDNISCSTSGIANGEAKAFVIDENGDDVPNQHEYNFEWYIIDPDPDTLYNVGQQIAGMVAGNYKVIALHSGKQCGSKTDTIEIQNITNLRVEVIQTKEHTDCENPDGELTAYVYENDVLVNNPSVYYTFRWFEGEQIGVGDVKSVNEVAAALNPTTHIIEVNDPSSGCIISATGTVTSSAPFPEITKLETKGITSCAEPKGWLQATADMANVTFTWYEGEGTLPPAVKIPGETGSKLEVTKSGTYTVTALLGKGCYSLPMKGIVEDQKDYPDFTFTPIHPTSCDPSNPDGELSIDFELKGKDNIKWYTGQNNHDDSNYISGSEGSTNITGLTPGWYSVEVKHAGCVTLGDFELLDHSVNPDATLINISGYIKNSTSCDPTKPNGAIGADYDGNTSGFEFKWYDGATANDPPGPDFTGNVSNGYIYDSIADGDYTVIVVDIATLCSSDPVTETVGIDQDVPVITTEVLSISTSCDPGFSNGSLKATAASTLEPTNGYYFEWFKGAAMTDLVTEDHNIIGNTGLSATGIEGNRTYYVRVTNEDNLCSSIADQYLDIQEVKPIISNPLSTDNTACAAPGNGQIDASGTVSTSAPGSEPAGGYTYYWLDQGDNLLPENGPVLTGLMDGNYYLYVQNNDTKCVSDTITVAVGNNLVEPTASVVLDNPLTTCDTINPNASLIGSATTSNGEPGAGYQFDWFEGTTLDTNIESGTAPSNYTTTSGLNAGWYTLQVTNLDTRCTGQSAPIEITKSNLEYPQINDKVITSNSYCRTDLGDGAIEITSVSMSSGPEPSGYSYAWKDQAGNLLSSTTAIAQDLLSQYYMVIVTNNDTKCQDSVEYMVPSDQLFPVITTSNPGLQISCDPAAPTGQLQASASSARPTINKYRFDWYDNSAVLTVSSPSNVDNHTTTANLAAGQYTVEVTNLDSECKNTASVEVVENLEYPVVGDPVITDNSYCRTDLGDGQINVNGVVSMATVEPSGGYSYRWEDESGTVLADTDFEVTALRSVTYSLTVTNNDTKCATDKNIAVPNTKIYPSILVTNPIKNTSCDPANPNGQLQGVPSTSNGEPATGYDFTWMDGTTILETASGAQHTTTVGLAKKAYTLKVRNLDSHCENSTIGQVEDDLVFPVLDVPVITPNTLCFINQGDGSIDASGKASMSIPSGFTYKWINPNGIERLETGATITDLHQGQYKVQAFSDHNHCASNIQEVQVDSIPVPVVVNITQTNPQTSCSDDPLHHLGALTAQADGSNAGYAFSWFEGLNTSGTPLTNAGNDYDINGLTDKTYSVKAISDATGCPGVASYKVTELITYPKVFANADSSTVCNPYNGKVKIEKIDELVEITELDTIHKYYDIYWENSDGSETNNDTTWTERTPDDYFVYVISRITQCQSSNTEKVTVEDKSPTIQADFSKVAKPAFCDTNDGSFELKATASLNNSPHPVSDWKFTYSKVGETDTTTLNPAIPWINYIVKAENLYSGHYNINIENQDNGCSVDTLYYLPFAYEDSINDNILAQKIDPTQCIAPFSSEIPVKIVINDVNKINGVTYENYFYNLYDTVYHIGDTRSPIVQINGSGLLSDTIRFTNLAPGIYTVSIQETFSGGHNCESKPIQVELIQDVEDPWVTFTSINDYSCNPSAKPLGQITATAENPAETDLTAGFSFAWDVSNVLSGDNYTTINAEIASGEYAVTVTNNRTGCDSTLTRKIINKPKDLLAYATITSQTNCAPDANGSFKLDSILADNVKENMADYSFDIPGATVDGTDPAKFIEISEGTYVLTATSSITDCEVAIDKNIQKETFNPFIIEALTSDQYCDPNTGNGKVAISIDETKFGGANPNAQGNDGYQIDWYLGSGTATPLDAAYIHPNADSIYSLVAGQVYTVQVTDTSGIYKNCISTEEYSLIKETPVLTISAITTQKNTNCAPVNGALDIEKVNILEDGSNDPSFDYGIHLYDEINDPATSLASDTLDGVHFNHQFASLTESSYRIEAMNTLTHCIATGYQVVEKETYDPYIVAQVSNDQFCDPNNGNGKISVSIDESRFGGIPKAQSTDDYMIEWFLGTGTSTPLPGPHTYAASDSIQNLVAGQVYTIRITDQAGLNQNCISTDQFTLVKEVPNLEISSITAVDQTNCSPGNGELTIGAITGDNVVSSYTNQLFDHDDLSTDIASAKLYAPDHYTNLEYGNYRVIVINDLTKCEAQKDQRIELASQDPVIIPTSLVHDAFCVTTAGVGSGEIEVAVDLAGTPTTAGYSYTWFNGDETSTDVRPSTTFSVTDLPSGKYTVEVIDNTTYLNCDSKRTFTVLEEPDDVVITSVTTSPQTDCTPDGAVAVANLKVNGAIASTSDFDPYQLLDDQKQLLSNTYTLPNGFTSLTAGKYYIRTFHATTECPSQLVQVDIGADLPNPAITLTAIPDWSCNEFGKGSITAKISENNVEITSGYDLSWTEQPSGSLIGSTYQLNDLKDGNYKLTITENTPGNSCTFYKNVSLANKLKYISITDKETIDQTYCTPNGSIAILEIQENGEVDPTAVYIYSLLDQHQQEIANTTVASLDPFDTLAAGTYYLTAFNQETGCEADRMMVTLKNTSSDPIVKVEVLSEQISKSPPATPTGSLFGSAWEKDHSVQTYNFIWSKEDTITVGTGTNLTAHTMDELPAGTYQVDVTNTITNCTATAFKSIMEEIESPIVYLSKQDMINCDPADGAIYIDSIKIAGIIDSLHNYNFYWYQGHYAPENLVYTSDGANPEGNIYQDITAGIYYVLAEEKTMALTSSAILVEIKDQSIQPEIMLINIKPQTSFNPDPQFHTGKLEIVVDGSLSSDGFIINWFKGKSISGQRLPQYNDILSVSGLTVGYYTVLVKDMLTGCESTATYYIEDDRRPVFISSSSAPNTFCVDANGKVSATVINPNTSYDYLWYKNDDTYPDGQPDYTGQVVETGMPTGWYVVVAVDQDDPYRFAKDSVFVDEFLTYPEISVVELSPQKNCYIDKPTGELMANAVEGLSYLDFTWYESPDSTNVVAQGMTATNLNAVTYLAKGTHRITGCYDFSEPVTITEQIDSIPTPIPHLIAHRTNCAYPNGAVDASVNGNQNEYYFHWYFGSNVNENPDYTGTLMDDLDLGYYTVVAQHKQTGCTSIDSLIEVKDLRMVPVLEVGAENATCKLTDGKAWVSILNPVSIESIEWSDGFSQDYGGIIDGKPAGTYTVWVATHEQCEASAEVEIKNNILIYNGVSANGDGANDIFKIACIDEFYNNNVKIFNRSGDKVFEMDNYDNEIKKFEGVGNRGIYLGNPELPIGTYFYIIDLRNGTEPVTGYLELLR